MSKLTIELGGKVRTACVKTMWFMEYWEQSRKPLVNGELETQMKSSAKMLWAALMCQCKMDGIEPDFTKEDIDNWIGFANIADVTEIVEAGAVSLAGKRTAEGEAQALVNPSLGTN